MLIRSGEEELAIEFRKIGLVPFEDIISEFEKKFESELHNISDVKDLINEEIYSTWDIIFLAKIYRANTFGILSLKDQEENVVGIIVRGRFSTDDSQYHNRWLGDNKALYHLIESKRTKKHVNNTYLIEQNLPVYVFETIESNRQKYKGVFKVNKYIEKLHSVELEKIDVSDSFTSNNTSEKDYKLPTTNRFTKMIDKKDTTRAGTDQIQERKKQSGENAENKIAKFLENIGYQVLNVANNPKYHYDIHIEDCNLGLEVKNIENGYFYISENEARQFEKGVTRLCFVDKEQLLISKKYEETNTLKNVFADIRKIDEDIIDKYNGVYQASDIKIGIDESISSELLTDFYILNEKDKKEIDARLS